MSYVPSALRQFVVERAGSCCEYCRLSREDHVLPFEIDPIIAEKHKGLTQADNLCLSYYDCNNAKGSDISSIDWEVTEKVTPLFHPRQYRWEDHFVLDGAIIIPLTPEGRVTVFLLDLNSTPRVEERLLLIQLGRYPCASVTFA